MYVIQLIIDGEAKYVFTRYAFIYDMEFAKRFTQKSGANEYARKYFSDKFDYKIINISNEL